MGVIEMNNFRKKKFFQRIFKALNSNLKKKQLCILGTAFKKILVMQEKALLLIFAMIY